MHQAFGSQAVLIAKDAHGKKQNSDVVASPKGALPPRLTAWPLWTCCILPSLCARFSPSQLAGWLLEAPCTRACLLTAAHTCSGPARGLFCMCSHVASVLICACPLQLFLQQFALQHAAVFQLCSELPGFAACFPLESTVTVCGHSSAHTFFAGVF